MILNVFVDKFEICQNHEIEMEKERIANEYDCLLHVIGPINDNKSARINRYILYIAKSDLEIKLMPDFSGSGLLIYTKASQKKE